MEGRVPRPEDRRCHPSPVAVAVAEAVDATEAVGLEEWEEEAEEVE